MKKTIARLEQFRDTHSFPREFRSSAKDGRNGRFFLPPGLVGRSHVPGVATVKMTLVISDASDWYVDELGPIRWEHASASWPDRTPTWSEMCRVKDLLWDDGECVLQFHPPKKDYVNHHKYCLHLWQPIGVDIPMPPSLAVGPTAKNQERLPLR